MVKNISVAKNLACLKLVQPKHEFFEAKTFCDLRVQSKPLKIKEKSFHFRLRAVPIFYDI